MKKLIFTTAVFFALASGLKSTALYAESGNAEKKVFEAAFAKRLPAAMLQNISSNYSEFVDDVEALLKSGGELFVLDMGEPIKIADLAKKMLILSNKEHLGVEFVGLRPGEKLYEELLINKDDVKTEFQSIFVTHSSKYDVAKLNEQIKNLTHADDVAAALKEIVPEFNHALNKE